MLSTLPGPPDVPMALLSLDLEGFPGQHDDPGIIPVEDVGHEAKYAVAPMLMHPQEPLLLGGPEEHRVGLEKRLVRLLDREHGVRGLPEVGRNPERQERAPEDRREHEGETDALVVDVVDEEAIGLREQLEKLRDGPTSLAEGLVELAELRQLRPPLRDQRVDH